MNDSEKNTFCKKNNADKPDCWYEWWDCGPEVKKMQFDKNRWLKKIHFVKEKNTDVNEPDCWYQGCDCDPVTEN